MGVPYQSKLIVTIKKIAYLTKVMDYSTFFGRRIGEQEVLQV